MPGAALPMAERPAQGTGLLASGDPYGPNYSVNSHGVGTVAGAFVVAWVGILSTAGRSSPTTPPVRRVGVKRRDAPPRNYGP